MFKAQHWQSGVCLGGEGWFPVAPADAYKAMPEHKLAPDDPEVHILHDGVFGAWGVNWADCNSATDIILPDVAEHQRPNFPFLMYPCAFIAMG